MKHLISFFLLASLSCFGQAGLNPTISSSGGGSITVDGSKVRTLVAGDNITLDVSGSEVTISSSTNVVANSTNAWPVVNVENYGATDGGGDDTDAFEAAAAVVNSSGGIFYIPKGSYKITNTIEFTGASVDGGMIPTGLIQGLYSIQGAGDTIVTAHCGATAAFKLSGGMRNVTVDGFTLVGTNNSASVESIGFELVGPTGGASIGCNISGFKIGVLGNDITDLNFLPHGIISSNYIAIATSKKPDQWDIDNRIQFNNYGIWIGYTNSTYTNISNLRGGGIKVGAIMGHNGVGLLVGAGGVKVSVENNYMEANTVNFQMSYNTNVASEIYPQSAVHLYLKNVEIADGDNINLHYNSTVEMKGCTFALGGASTNAQHIVAKQPEGNTSTLYSDIAYTFRKYSGTTFTLGRGMFYSTTGETLAIHGNVSPTELGYLDGVTSAIQTQINAKLIAPTNSGSDDQLLKKTGANTAWVTASSGVGATNAALPLTAKYFNSGSTASYSPTNGDHLIAFYAPTDTDDAFVTLPEGAGGAIMTLHIVNTGNATTTITPASGNHINGVNDDTIVLSSDGDYVIITSTTNDINVGWWVSSRTGGNGGSQTPLTADVNGAGYSVTNLGTLETTNLTAQNITGQASGGPKILLNGALGSDDTWSGNAITNMLGGETVAQWELVRVHSDGFFHLADADASGEFPAIGIASDGVSVGTNINVIVQGTVRNDAWNWTIGGSLYLSATAGGLTQTPPSTSTHAVQRVGVALSADIAYFNFSGEWTVNE